VGERAAQEGEEGLAGTRAMCKEGAFVPIARERETKWQDQSVGE